MYRPIELEELDEGTETSGQHLNMSDIPEPPLKRMKYENNGLVLKTINNFIHNITSSDKPIQIILEDDSFGPIPLIKVYVGHIKDPRLISKAVLALNEKIPLKDLQHLKRVKKRDIILCPIHFLNGMPSIQQYLECHVQELNDVFEYFKEVDVPCLPPKVTSQYKEAQRVWSVNFHPNKYLEDIVSNNLFNLEERTMHRQFMAMTFEVMLWYIDQYNLKIDDNDIFKDVNAAVVVDPSTDHVVAVVFDNRIAHPMQHAAMLAIDNVAKTQNGGAWASEEEKKQSQRSLSGVDEDLYMHLKAKFPDIKFGAKKFISKRDQKDSDDTSGPYLCTGYYIYLLKEPCVMCTMGLVHARIDRVFYCIDNTRHGALKSQTKLHLNTSLNHHFEVFTGFL